MAAGSEADRAEGALLGGALGDAVGMPAQTLTPEAIRAAYGRIGCFEAALPLALAAAREGGRRGHPVGARDVGPRIAAALALAAEGCAPEALAAAVGTSVATAESVPAAFGLLRLAGGEVWPAALMAANIGGDTDTIGAIAGAMGGACTGASTLPAGPLAELRAANALDIGPLVAGLIALRGRARAAA